jgi:membrane-associated phospholipid phosphatase
MNVAALPPNRATPTSPPVAASTQADRAIRLAGLVTTAYLTLTVWPMWLYADAAGARAPLMAHLVALALAIAVLARRSPRILADWLPLALGPFLYVELRWLIAGVGRPHADATVVAWEQLVFPMNPSATWAPSLPSVPLSEALHAAYASYYLLVFVPPALLYLRGARRGFARTMLALAVVYGICFITYLMFPVDGPRFLVGPAVAPEGPIRAFVLQLLAAGSSRGTAFPSSHVAAALVASLAALSTQRRVGVAVTLLTAGLALGTVYGGFHYAVDAWAGLATGFAAWLVAEALWRRLADGAQSASAA